MKKDMGGLRKFMPITFSTWIVSTLALCGVFPFSGFFSKDEIIDNVGYAGYNFFMIVGLFGAFLTAAYMTRATYLTFFGEPRGAAAGEHHDEEHGHDAHASHDDHGHDDHGHDSHDAHAAHDSHDDHASHGPRESGLIITIPLILLATLALSSGFLNAPAFGEKWENLKKWVEPRAEVVNVTGIAKPGGAYGETRTAALKEAGSYDSPCGSETPVGGVCYAPQLKHAPFKWWKAGMSVGIVFLGMILSWVLSVQLYTRKNKKLVGLTERNKVLGAGYSFLANKYYLDTLYEKIIVRSIAYPISRGAYWFNQNVLDGIVNGAGSSTRKTAGWVYRNVDQKLVDGAVNGAGTTAENAGGALQPVQSGKVNQYGALLFGAAAIGALVLVIINF
jgi:NADH-quinone oxidoreductase subunit L